jgi:hypothetical protein
MAWDVEFPSQFETWWNSLSPDEQVETSAKVELFEERGPTLPRPQCGRDFHFPPREHEGVAGKVEDRHLRVLYALDPRRAALLLLGGDKTGDPKWYNKSVPIADDLFDHHLKQLEPKRPR